MVRAEIWLKPKTNLSGQSSSIWLVVPEEGVEGYKRLLAEYYESENDREIVDFLKKYAYTNV